MIKTTKKIIFWIAIAFIVLTVFSLTIGQRLPYEFADYKLQQGFYDTIIQGLPIAFLLTLLWTIKRENTKGKNWIFLGFTVLISGLCFVGELFLIFSFGFGFWTTETTLYRHKTENKVIKEQRYDIGAFGYGGRRIVEIKPVLKFWILPTPIDTVTINKNEWELTNLQGDINFPSN
ncbi:MAG: hypothetical protein K0M50_04100 [Prolixibacteraceae bacterium]|nr:hypothetical protein [Prolixibacteraceae bacterium]